jgi:hypothetical protein
VIGALADVLVGSATVGTVGSIVPTVAGDDTDVVASTGDGAATVVDVATGSPPAGGATGVGEVGDEPSTSCRRHGARRIGLVVELVGHVAPESALDQLVEPTLARRRRADHDSGLPRRDDGRLGQDGTDDRKLRDPRQRSQQQPQLARAEPEEAPHQRRVELRARTGDQLFACGPGGPRA